jgi:ribosomal protein S18 acetylase RimI-like enzyme
VGAFRIREATSVDLPHIIEVQHRAFSRVARSHGIAAAELPPLQESVEDLRVLRATRTRFFVATSPSGAVVGAVRGFERDGTVAIGRLVVDDGFERLGIATALMDALECAFSPCQRFEIFTGTDAADAIALYTGRGYTPFDRRRMETYELVWLEKQQPSAL